MHDSKYVENGKPEIINDHNVGINVLDQLCANYVVALKTRSWPIVLFYT